MPEATERAVIARDRGGAGRGRRHARRSAGTPSRRPPSTRGGCWREEGGFLYDSDAYDDDLPRLVQVGGAPHVILPYAFDTNDMRFAPGQGFVQAEDFSDYCIGAFDQLLRRAAPSRG